MRLSRSTTTRIIVLLSLIATLSAISSRMRADTATCGSSMVTVPFTDVAASRFFCEIAEAYFSGLTNGTTGTTYSPAQEVTREQMAAFITRTMDQAVKRSSRRIVLGQTWNSQTQDNLQLITIKGGPAAVESDGEDVWVANFDDGTVSRVHATNGKVLGSWTGATKPIGVLCAMDKVFVIGHTSPGMLFLIDPRQPPGPVTTLSSSLGDEPRGVTYDGERIWTANASGSVSVITLKPVVSVINITRGFDLPFGIIFDGTRVWVTDTLDNSLKKLDSFGNVVLTVRVGDRPRIPVFDGTNIWVPNFLSSSVSVVRATGGLAGTVLATITGNGLNGPSYAAFDGERIIVTNLGGDVSLWKASDLAPLGTFSTGTNTTPDGPGGVCSDGLNFWITLRTVDRLARY